MPSLRRPSLSVVLLLVLVALPMGGAMAAYLSGTNAQPLPPTPRLPSLAFHQYLVDLGNVRPSGELVARFAFSNMGDQTVTIKEVTSSCGCLKPIVKHKVFAPGKTGDFLARILTANEAPGPREFTLTVKYNDPEPREELLTFRVNLPENQVLIRPRSLMFYQLNGNDSTQDVVITDQRSRSLELQNVMTSSSAVKAELLPKTLDETGHAVQKVRITVSGKVPPRMFHALVTVGTDDATYRFLKIPLMIQGPNPSLTQGPQPQNQKIIRTAHLPGPVTPRQ